MADKRKKKKTMKSLALTARLLALFILVLIVLVLIPISVPRMFGYQTYDVVSSSMEPTIPQGSLILVRQIAAEEVKKDDVIAFESDGSLVCHRVVNNNVFDSKFTTKGDANETEDLKDVDYTQLTGIVVGHLPLLGMIGSYVSTFSGKLLVGELIVVCVLLFAVAERIRS